MKQHRETFNDGFLVYGQKTTERKNGKRIGDKFEPIGRLAYKEMSCRDSDYQMAAIGSSSLDIKIKTPYPPSLMKRNKSKLTIVIDQVEYEVLKADPDYSKSHLYFYLQEVGAVNE